MFCGVCPGFSHGAFFALKVCMVRDEMVFSSLSLVWGWGVAGLASEESPPLPCLSMGKNRPGGGSGSRSPHQDHLDLKHLINLIEKSIQDLHVQNRFLEDEFRELTADLWEEQ